MKERKKKKSSVQLIEFHSGPFSFFFFFGGPARSFQKETRPLLSFL